MAWFYEHGTCNNDLKHLKASTHMNNSKDNSSMAFNVMEEQAQVYKEVVENAKVRIVKKVHEEEATVDTSAKSEVVKVERVPIEKYVEAAPEIRYDGNTMIVPVVQEVVVVQKRLLLVEEVHITKTTTSTPDEKTMPLKREEVIVERVTTE
jgi:uncharacterized protein (TIGR02271 family)